MIYLDKQIKHGQTLHFLTGDSINDNFFYDLHSGIKNLADTLRDYYVVRETAFDYIVQIISLSSAPICFSASGEIKFDEIINPPTRKDPLGKKSRLSKIQYRPTGSRYCHSNRKQ